MLSKEEKLRYGEALRQQMKEKQEMKRNQLRGKRANQPPAHTQSDRTVLADPSILNQKDILQQRLQTQEYNPFGKAGGGAPNPKGQQPQQMAQNSSLLAHSSQQYPPNGHLPVNSMENIPSNYRNSSQAPQIPTTQQSAPYLATYQAYNYPPSPPKQPQGPVMETQNYSQAQYQQQYQPQYQQISQPPQRGYQQYSQQQQQRQPQYQQQLPAQRIPQEYQVNSRVYQQQQYQPTIMQRQAPPQRQRIKTVQNEELQELYKKGGRNLLRLENQTMNEHLVKQKQKQQMQAFLKQQMEEAERRKQEEKEKLKREEMQEERRNKEYLERQNQRLKDEQNKKLQDKQRIVEENLRNLEIKKQEELMAKEKAERQNMDRQYKKQLQIQRQRDNQLVEQQQHNKNYHPHKQEIDIPRSGSSSSSVSSSESTYSKGFNTNISKDFLRKEREKDHQRHRNDKKLQQFTSQIQKMKDQIMNQGEVFQKELDKIKRQAEYAQDEKRRAELEVQKLKLQLEKKNKESQLRLLQALKRNNPYMPQRMPPPEPVQNYHHPQTYEYDSLNELEQDDYNDRPYGIPTQAPPPKPMSKAKKRVYEQPEPEPVKMPPRPARGGKQWQKQFSLDDSNVGTLDADSKKIPVQLQGGTKLTLSGVDDMGKDAYSFGKKSQAKAFRADPIDQFGSRASKRSQKDQLDRLVENKWQMSTVREDITKEIEQLLKKKDNHNLQPSQVSRIAQSRGAIPYQGPALGTLNSNKASLVSQGTFDVDRIHGRNEARLRQLKALGVQTINTTNDDDLNRLNALLNNY